MTDQPGPAATSDPSMCGERVQFYGGDEALCVLPSSPSHEQHRDADGVTVWSDEPGRGTTPLQKQVAVAKRRGYNQAVRRIRDLAPYSRDPQQVRDLADLLASLGPDMPDLSPPASSTT